MNLHAQRRLGIAALLLAAGLSLYVMGSLDLQPLLERLDHIPAWLLLLVIFAAPLAGVPLSALLVIAGARFSLATGLLIAFTVLLAHHLLVFWLSRTPLWARLQNALARRRLLPTTPARRRLGDDLLFILAATWVPGLSYVFKLALTRLAGIPFRIYLLAGVLSQTLAALPYLVLGGMAAEANLGWIGAAIFALAALSWLLKRFVFKSGNLPSFDDRAERP